MEKIIQDLLESLGEIRQNSQRLLDGELPHFSRHDFARAILRTCDKIIHKAEKALAKETGL